MNFILRGVISFLFIFRFCHLAFATEMVQVLPKVETYDELLDAIQETKMATRRQIEQAVEQEKVREAWKIGKLIDRHVLHHKERADYATYVIARLAKDMEMDPSELYRMRKFARIYPIVAPGPQLSWSHYRALVTIDDPEKRRVLTERAEKEHWDRNRTRAEVIKSARRNSTGENEIFVRLEAKPGKLHIYRVIRAKAGKYKDQLMIDLGFANYYRPEQKLGFKEGDIIQAGKGKLRKLDGGSDQDRYTYEADVIEVIDGDTFTAVIDLGFGFNTVQKLRLRGLDAPEIESAEGREAKEFLEKLLGQSAVKFSKTLVRTSRSDKYDRYLADLFVGGEYVNQKLVEQGLAIIVEE